MLQVIAQDIPDELKNIPQWVCWKAVPKANGKIDKIPYDPKTGKAGDSTDPAKWDTFSRAFSAYGNDGGYAGIGFTLNGSKITGVDFDDCVNPDTGEIEPSVLADIKLLNTYTEKSPSGKGLRAFLKGKLPPKGRRRENKKIGVTFEVYEMGRFLTVTGHKLEGLPGTIEERQVELDDFHKRHIAAPPKLPRPKNPPINTMGITLEDTELINKARNAKNGAIFDKLFGGDWTGYGSQSEADLALCNKLAFWTGKNAEQMDRLFRKSGLCREKWERDDYRNNTIQKAIDDCREVYTGGRTSVAEDFGELDWDDTINEQKEQKEQVADVNTVEVKQQPAIQANNRFLPSLTKQALGALAAKNYPPYLFIRDGKIVRLLKILDKDNEYQTYYRPIIELVNEATLRGYLARSAQYVNVREKKGGLVSIPTVPPMELVRDVMTQDNLPLPLLRGIVQAPILRYDGSLFTKAGYDEVSSLYYVPEQGFQMPDVPEKPTKEDVQSSVNSLKDIVCDFPFDSESSLTNIIAAIITPVLRDFIAGPVPLLLIDKPLQGTGASLLSDVISIIATGANSYMTTAPDGDGREEEWRKRITAILLESKLITVVDNLEEVFRSPTLCALLTSTNWSDRILGRTENVGLQHRTCWIATGNNVRLAGDMPRRCYIVRMDANQAKPWQRDTKKFKYPNLIQHIKQKRGALLAAVYTMARAWIQADRPAPMNTPTMGSFEEWRDTIGGILEFAGVAGFLRNTALIYANAEVNEGIEPFIQVWHEIMGTNAITTKELQRRINYIQHGGDKLRDALPDWLDPGERGFTRKLGRVLAKKAGVHFTNGYKLEKCGVAHQAQLWKVYPIG
jgi:hypothetical protein